VCTVQDGDESTSQPPAEIQLDDDLAMTQTVNIKCPYTGKEMIKPFRNKHCSHNYEYDGIIEYIKTKDGRARYDISTILVKILTLF